VTGVSRPNFVGRCLGVEPIAPPVTFIDLFAYPAGDLVGQGGWVAGVHPSLVVVSSGVVDTVPGGNADAAHEVSYPIVAPWELRLESQVNTVASMITIVGFELSGTHSIEVDMFVDDAANASITVNLDGLEIMSTSDTLTLDAVRELRLTFVPGSPDELVLRSQGLILAAAPVAIGGSFHNLRIFLQSNVGTAAGFIHRVKLQPS